MKRVLRNAILASIIASATSAQTAPSWSVDVTSRGGFTASESRRVIDWNGTLRVGGCRFALTDSELKAIEKALAKARPERWAGAYGRDQICCDLVTYEIVLTRSDARGRHSTFHSSWTLGAPEDLAALTRAVLEISRDAAQCQPQS